MNKAFKLIMVLLSLVFSGAVQATHIVGGEFELRERRGGLYDIYLNLYFDAINGNPDAVDDPLVAAVYNKTNNQLEDIINLELIFNDEVPYENPDCAIDPLKTNLIRYRTPTGFQFDAKYDDPGGYYIVYDRCCRNNIITNIIGPENTGMLFYLEFPPIYKPDGTLTGFSSPVFNTIKTRYACLDEYFELDFGAVDPDGDSLSYRMVHPLRGNSNTSDPIVDANEYLAGPYPEVVWADGYNENDAIHGTPALGVNTNTGLLTTVATENGLYVFSVACDIFRDGVKIGEVRRDFQILVAPCDPNSAPEVFVEDADTVFSGDSISLFVANDGDRCFDFYILDNKDPRTNERYTISVEAVNFEPIEPFDLDGATGIVGNDTLGNLGMCWPKCSEVLDEPYILKVIVEDDGCILPKKDTITLAVTVEPEANNKPELSWDYKGQNGTGDLEIDLLLDSFAIIDFTGVDLDSGDVIQLTGNPQGFTFNETRMAFRNVTGTDTVRSTFAWKPTCEQFITLGPEYNIWFLLEDNRCFPEEDRDSVKVKFNVIEPEKEVAKFIPSNIFTPNGDGFNDTFSLPTLPKDICGDAFVTFKVYNRWGKKVFGVDDRSFIWDGGDVPDGTYYFTAEYELSTYKGFVTISR